MQVLVSSDHTITSSEDLVARISTVVSDGLDRSPGRMPADSQIASTRELSDLEHMERDRRG